MTIPAPPATASSAKRAFRHESVLNQVQEDARLYASLGLLDQTVAEHSKRWRRRFARPRQALVGRDGRIDADVLCNFRRDPIYITDNPRSPLNPLNPLSRLLGSRRGEWALMNKCLRTLHDYGYLDILERNPTPDIGRPHIFTSRGYRTTHRWFRSVYMAGLLRQTLGERLPRDFIALDIGGAYGIFSALLRREHPASRQIIVDLPEQLLLARYFLANYAPEARIAGIAQTSKTEFISRDFFDRHDFLLLPPGEYRKIAPGTVDLVASFAALGEMKRSFFEYYINAPTFRDARYFMTANPVDSRPLFPDSDVCVLDYPIAETKKRIHFAISGAYDHPYARPISKYGMFYRLKRFRPFFEYVGEI